MSFERLVTTGLLLAGAGTVCCSAEPDAGGRGTVSADTGAPASYADRPAVLEELRAYYRDFSARDWEAFAEHFWSGATLATVWQPPDERSERVVVTTVTEFVARAPQGPGSRQIFKETMEDAEIRVHRSLAQAWVRYRVEFGDPGSVATWSGIDVFTLLKHDGRWKIVALAYTADN